MILKILGSFNFLPDTIYDSIKHSMLMIITDR